MGDHPVWASLLEWLEGSGDGELLATNCLLVKGELTPMEFLSASAAQCFTIEPWALRVELFKACAVAIRMGDARVHSFAQTIFEQLIHVTPDSVDDEYCCRLVDLYVELVLGCKIKSPTMQLLRVVYDPLLTRVGNVELAQVCAQKVLIAIEHDLETLTVQEILLTSAFAEKQAGLEDDEEEDESLSEWEGTSDSTDSSVDMDPNFSDSRIQVPLECMAAACYFLAPDLLPSGVLSEWGKFKWAQPSARYLLRNTPSKSLAAKRGFELFCGFGPVYIHDEDDVLEMVVAAVNFCVELQSVTCRNAVQAFISQLSPHPCTLLVRIAEDASQISPGVRAWALDVLRQQLVKCPELFEQVQQSVLDLLQVDGQDLEIYAALFALLRLVKLKRIDVDGRYASEVIVATKRIHQVLMDMEQEIDKDMVFQLRATEGEGQGVNVATRQAELGRARLASSLAEEVIQNWQ
ncbi:hypothetical protein BASA81_003173 [Batrachochytrium salamandrivorans]|nr:hypothetical protein BASA81_003173 [Batrachochytrium salamandrivorans]